MSSEAKVSYELKRFSGIKRDYTAKDVERLKNIIIKKLDEINPL